MYAVISHMIIALCIFHFAFKYYCLHTLFENISWYVFYAYILLFGGFMWIWKWKYLLYEVMKWCIYVYLYTHTYACVSIFIYARLNIYTLCVPLKLLHLYIYKQIHWKLLKTLESFEKILPLGIFSLLAIAPGFHPLLRNCQSFHAYSFHLPLPLTCLPLFAALLASSIM